MLWPELIPTQSETLGLNPMPLSSQISGLTPYTPSLACSWAVKQHLEAEGRGLAEEPQHKTDFGIRH